MSRGRGLAHSAVVAIGFLLVAPSAAFSHHPSGVASSSASGPIITIPGTTLAQGSSALFIATQHTAFDEISDPILEAAALREEDVHSLRQLDRPLLGFAYGLTDRLMFSFLMPYVVQTGIREGVHHEETGELENKVVDLGNSKGIADLTLLAQYRFFGNGSDPQASLLAGMKTPTGNTGERDSEGELFDAEFQPGSGSWDGLIGVAISKPLGRWSLDGNFLYTVATEGTQQTDLGDRFQYNGSISYRVIGTAGDVDTSAHMHNGTFHRHESDRLAMDLALELNGEWQAKETIANETDPNSGGDVLYFSPGLRLTSNRLSGFISVGLPLMTDLNGLQSEPTYRVVGGLVAGF